MAGTSYYNFRIVIDVPYGDDWNAISINIDLANASFYQNGHGSDVPPNPVFFAFDPDLEYDSYFTVPGAYPNGYSGEPDGACCYPDGTCAPETQSECASHGGDYQGDGTDCYPNPCTPNEPPVADAGGSYSGIVGEEITFDASGSDDPDGTIVEYHWWTPDGTTWDSGWITSETVGHTFSGEYDGQVWLEVKDNEGATDTDPTFPRYRTTSGHPNQTACSIQARSVTNVGGSSGAVAPKGWAHDLSTSK